MFLSQCFFPNSRNESGTHVRSRKRESIVADMRLGGVVTRRHDGTTVSSTREYAPVSDSVGGDTGTTSSPTWKSAHGGGKRGRGLPPFAKESLAFKVASHAKSLCYAVGVFFSIGIVISIAWVLYEYRSLPSLRQSGHADGPICGRRAGVPPKPVVQEKNGDDLRKMSIPQFIDKHIKGYQPVIFRGGLNSTVLERLQSAMTDEKLSQFFKDIQARGGDNFIIESEVVENRANATYYFNETVETFMENYQKLGWYMVYPAKWAEVENTTVFDSFPVPRLLADVLNVANARGVPQFPATNFWWSGGGVKSVVHHDAYMNFHFCISGTKTFYVTDPSFQDDLYFPTIVHTFPDDMYQPLYSESQSPVKFYDPDYAKYPRYKNVKWTKVVVKEGDMLFLPKFMVHYVESPKKTRNTSLNFFVWDDLVEANSIGYRGGCPGVVDWLSRIPRALIQYVKDVYFLRASYLLTWINIMPIHYYAFTSWLELYCREGFRFAWTAVKWDYEEEEKYALQEDAYTRMIETLDDFDDYAICVHTDETWMLSIVGVIMLLGATVTYIVRELRITFLWDLIANRKVS